MVDGLLIGLGAAALSFGLGYGFKRVNLKWETQAKTAEKLANTHADQLQATVSASLDGIIVIDLHGKIVDFSESAERIFGYKKQDVLGQSMAELIVPERYRDAHNAGVKRMRETGKEKILGQRIEIEAIRADGTEFMSELAVSRNTRDNGDIFIAYIRDISEAKAAQKALVEAKDAAEKANHVKSKFLAAMSHEIRTPFNAVLGILDILGETKLNKDQRELVKTAEKSSLSLLRVINDVLDYARISSGKYTTIKDVFSAQQVFDDVFQLFKVKAKEKGVIFEIDISKAEDIYLSGDLGRIRQILMNFVSNAIKFTNNGRIILKIETSQIGVTQWALKCTVSDTGIGISESALTNLFDEFFMVDDSDSRRHDGTGLGLTISKTIAEMMDGHVGVDSQLGTGSDFWVSIPLERVESNNIEPRYHQTNIDISQARILLAEDNKTNQMVVSRVLKPQCKSLTIVDNGKAALEALEAAAFDIVLMDIFMPEMSGKEALRHIRESGAAYKNIPIIALTAMGNFHEIQNLKTIGMNEIVTKPFKRKDLFAAIAANISSHKNPLQNVTSPKDMHTPDPKKYIQSALKNLFGEISDEEFLSFKTQFKEDLRQITDELHMAVKDGNLEEVKRASHTLKGLCAMYGFTQLSQLAALTEKLSQTGDIETSTAAANKTIKLAKEHLANMDELFTLAEAA